MPAIVPSSGILGESRGLGKNTYDSATILAYYARQFGFDAPTGIDIGGDHAIAASYEMADDCQAHSADADNTDQLA